MIPIFAQHRLSLAGFGCRRRRIGLLGGSFNPAHDGHLHVSLIALRRLGLDEVWWLVSPQNPLKPMAGMAPLAQRLQQARRVARHPRLRVSGVERDLNTRYTADTLEKLTRCLPRARFVWLMGADNLKQMDRWSRWWRIFRRVAIAVLARGPYSLPGLAGKAARRFAQFRLKTARSRSLADHQPPAWVFLPIRLHPASATDIRNQDLIAREETSSTT
ncbi:MAG: nicotinate-nucleotide adenylyltransferase [Alphaproteobacteria bacterium]